MITVSLNAENDFEEWRGKARRLISARIDPQQVRWAPPGAGADLFASPPDPAPPAGAAHAVAPKQFLSLARHVICHRDENRFFRLYRLLYRLQSEKNLLQNPADADIDWLFARRKAISRDLHKMKAFVRFRRAPRLSTRENYVAWFEPDHRIVEAAAPFFMRRFTGMDWTILTPERSVSWDGANLRFGSGARREDAPAGDLVEAQWRAYFASIFNPARVKIKAMTAEMPKKYWKNLPEAALIRPLLQSAEQRSQAMRDNAVSPPNIRTRKVGLVGAAAAPAPPKIINSMSDLRRAMTACRECPLYEQATQTVCGAGPQSAAMMIVGEQPGDQEDLAGAPFVGPAGKVLNRALIQAGLDRNQIYATNAVKHFKFSTRGRKRIHRSPSKRDINHCRPWLQQEINLVEPQLLLALGGSAAHSLLGRPVKVLEARGQIMRHESGAELLITIHPAYLLRQSERQPAAAAYAEFVADLSLAKSRLAA